MTAEAVTASFPHSLTSSTVKLYVFRSGKVIQVQEKKLQICDISCPLSLSLKIKKSSDAGVIARAVPPRYHSRGTSLRSSDYFFLLISTLVLLLLYYYCTTHGNHVNCTFLNITSHYLQKRERQRSFFGEYFWATSGSFVARHSASPQWSLEKFSQRMNSLEGPV